MQSLEAIITSVIGALVGAAFTILGVWWTVRAASREAAEAKIDDALEDLETALWKSIKHIQVLEKSENPKEEFDPEIWRDQLRAAGKSSLRAARHYKRLSKGIWVLTSGFNNQLGAVRWDSPGYTNLDRVLYWLFATVLVIEDWRVDKRKFRSRRAPRMEDYVNEAAAWLDGSRMGLHPKRTSGGSQVTFYADENLTTSAKDPRYRGGKGADEHGDVGA